MKTVFADTGYWIAVCDPLRQTVSGETWAELNESIADTIDLIFRELLETNQLRPFLREHGWSLQQRLPERPRNVRFDVPWSLVERRRVYAGQEAVC